MKRILLPFILLVPLLLVVFTSCEETGGVKVTTITVAPLTASIEVNGTQQFTATVNDQDGAGMTGVSVTWASSDETVATIDASGLATGTGAGEATITASADGINGTATLTVSVAYDLTKLNAVSIATGPTTDGVVDALWESIPALSVPLGETYDVHDPASINDCSGCHNFDSNVTVTLKAAYTSNKIYFLAQWPDPTASFTRGNSWFWDDTISGANKWNRQHHTAQSEDRIAFFFPIGNITGSPQSTGGCMTKCHAYYPTDTDPHVSSHGIVDDAWLVSGRADMWHTKSARCGALLSASGTGLTIDPATFEVTAGSFSMLGYADDKYVDVWADDATNGEDGGRYGDAGTSTYSHNRISDKSRPKYMETAPVDYADAMFLTQAEIDAGEVVGDATAGVSDSLAAIYWPAYTALRAVVPERILRQPDGSRGDIKSGATWTNGTWVTELERLLDTGHDDDVRFNPANEYLFNVAAFENSRHGFEHRTSESYYLKFTE